MKSNYINVCSLIFNNFYEVIMIHLYVSSIFQYLTLFLHFNSSRHFIDEYHCQFQILGEEEITVPQIFLCFWSCLVGDPGSGPWPPHHPGPSIISIWQY